MKLVPFNSAADLISNGNFTDAPDRSGSCIEEKNEMTLAEAVLELKQYIVANRKMLKILNGQDTAFNDYYRRHGDAIETVLKALDKGGKI